MHKISLKLNNPISEVTITPQKTPLQKKSQSEDITSSKLVEQAYNKGYLEGMMAGRKQVDELKICLQNALKQLDNPWGLVLDQLQLELSSLILHIVERLLLENIAANNYRIEHIVEKVIGELAMASNLEILEIYCNPEDLLAVDGGQTAFNLLPDPQVAKGDCVVKTDIGRVVVSLKDRLKQLHKKFREVDFNAKRLSQISR